MTTSIRRGEALDFEVFGRRIAAKCWGDASGTPTFALHGWLDNANSFDRLAPFLPELNLIALDFAGHGHSDHRGQGEHYHPLGDIQDVMAVAQDLGWDQFGLIGHSMGAGIASELAAMFPAKVTTAVMVDGFVATGGVSVEDRLEQYRSSIERMVASHDVTPRTYADVDALAQRVSEATDQSLAAAAVLIERGHKQVEDGVTWRTDPRIRFPSPYRHNREYLDTLLRGSTARSLLIVAEQGDRWYQGEIAASQKAHPNLTVANMPGPHHIHLEPKYVRQVAALTRDFLTLSPLSQDPTDQIEWDGTI